MDEMTPKSSIRDSYTVGWICALHVELVASMAMLDYEFPSLLRAEGDTNSYILGRIGQHNVALTCLPSGTTGTNAAANAATNMLRSFPNIRFGLMVGIGGGAPDIPSNDSCEDIRLGDVVVSCPSANSGGVLQYDFGKTMSEGKFVQTGVLNKPSIILSNSVSTLRARHRIEESRIPQHISHMLESNERMQGQFSHPGPDCDQFFRADYEHLNGSLSCRSCDKEALVSRKPRENTNPAIHYGLIGSANVVMKHGATRDKLRDEKNIICFEMEAAGLMDVFPCLVVRGVCDYADSHKSKRWQPYAAVTAAAYAKEVLLTTPTSEAPGKSVFNGEAIYTMLQATLCEFNWDQLLDLLPVRGYTHHEFLETLDNCDDPKFHWALKNIDFKQWNLNQGSRVLCLTGHPSESDLNQLSSYVVGQEKAAGYSILPLLCSNMKAATNITTLLLILLLELVYCSPEAQRASITRGFFGKLLETISDKDFQGWKEEKFNEGIFLKYMENVVGKAATKDVLNSLKTAFDVDRQRRLLVVISNLDAIESANAPDGHIQLLMKHLQQRNSNVKILLTSSERSDFSTYGHHFLHIEYNKERKECIRSFQFDDSRYNKISKEYEGSFEWIWSHNEYKSWSASDTSRLFYIQGKPGSGKSTLMKYFNQNLLLKEPAAQQAVVARFFYSFADGELQRSHYNMLLSVLCEIVDQDEGFFYHQCQIEYRAQQRFGPHFTWDYDSLKRILRSLQDYRTERRFYFTIDAIDESEEKDRREILSLLLELCFRMKHSIVKIFMASRPVAQLEARKDQFHNFIKLDDETRSDLYQYAQSQLYGLKSTDLLAQATAYMLQNAQGVFLWVKLTSEQLIAAHEAGYSEEDVFELLKRLPTELENFYGLMLEKMKQNEASHLYAAKIFQFILFARRPLTVDEILHALGILDNAASDPRVIPSDETLAKQIPASERVILSSGGNFLEIKELNGSKMVQMMHQTVREFFLSPDGPVSNSEFRISEKHAHINIATTCIRYLSVCATNTSLVGKLPTVNYWNTMHYKGYCQYLTRRPLASYALKYTKSHIEICEQDPNVKYATCQLIERLIYGNAAASLLERWAGSGLYHDSLSRSNIQDAAAMSFRCEMLRVSSKYGFSIAAELVLLAETALDTRDRDGRTPLSLAAGNGHEPTVKLLLDEGAIVYTGDNNSQAPLLRAAKNGHRDIVMWLSQYGASFDTIDRYGMTPLSWAAKNDHLTIIRLLAELGAKIEYEDRLHRTPLSWAAEHGSLAVIRFLVEKGAKIEYNDFRKTPLSRAAKHGHLATVRFLVENGATIDYHDFRQTPLSCAAEHGHLAIVRFLVEQGARVEANYDFSEAPLLLAVEKGHLDIVKYLAGKGANIKIKDGKDKTLLSTAVENNRLDIVEFLTERW